jgi:predicted nucleic acid-binding protein
MAERRRIVPDNSVLALAMLNVDDARKYPKRAERARQVLSALMNKNVVCFAPDLLMVEFTTVAYRRLREKAASQADVDEQLHSFLRLPVNYIPAAELADAALRHCRRDRERLSPTDSWYLAAAEERTAELWISHFQSDGFTVSAARIYGKVFTLEKDDFYSVGKRNKGTT